MRIGFIGLGIMGRPMASNLIKAGFSLAVYNRTPDKRAALAALGSTEASTPAAAAEGADVVISIVSDTPDVEAVLFGAQGAAIGAKDGTVFIDMSTISPEATAGLARRIEQAGGDMLDAPVTGGEKGAIEGTLTIMVGGKREVFERCLPVLKAMGKNIVYTGSSGCGQKTKLVNQVLCGLHLVAMSEGLEFARRLGLDLETTLNAVSSGAAGSWALSNLGPRVLRGDLGPGFMITLQQKDLRLVDEAAGAAGLTLPGADLAYKLFTRALEAGYGELGTQALIKLYEASAAGA